MKRTLVAAMKVRRKQRHSTHLSFCNPSTATMVSRLGED